MKRMFAVVFAIVVTAASGASAQRPDRYVDPPIVRSFNWPGSRALLTELVPETQFPNVVAWNASVFQGATILGPALGGVTAW